VINQCHQSDREQASVLIDWRGSIVQPAEVAFSEHCYGAHLAPNLVRWAGTHPIVYVGRGSHANYGLHDTADAYRPAPGPLRLVRLDSNPGGQLVQRTLGPR
jgi:hypothetical protein